VLHLDVISWLLEPSDPSVTYRTLTELLQSGDAPEAAQAQTLLAFSMLPEYRNHPRCLHLIDYFLSRNGLYKKNDRTVFVSKDMESDSFPIVWRTNVWEVLYALSKLGCGKDPRMADAWRVMDSRADAQGRYALDWTPPLSPWKVGKTGQPNKWVTLYCMLAKKYAGIPLQSSGVSNESD
jgi:hypothetical protein